MITAEQQIDDMVDRYTVDELKEVCGQIHAQIMHGNGAADEIIHTDLQELTDEYDLWAKAHEKAIGYVGTS